MTFTLRLFGHELIAIHMTPDDPVTLFESEEDEL